MTWARPYLGHSHYHRLPQSLAECLNEFLTLLGVSQNNFHLFHLASIIGWRRASDQGLDLKQSCLSLFLKQEKNVSKNYYCLQGARGVGPCSGEEAGRRGAADADSLRKYTPQRQAIGHYSFAGLLLPRRLHNVQLGHTTLHQPRGNKWHPFGRLNGLGHPRESVLWNHLAYCTASCYR